MNLCRRSRSSVFRCSCVECGRSTYGRKTYCCEHVERMPYVRELMAEIERRGRAGMIVEPPGPRI